MSDASSSTTENPPEHRSAHVVLNLAGAQVEFDLTVPTAPVRPAMVLPVLHGLWSTIESGLVEQVEQQGRRISCRAGCGACCRQLVPITRIEARRLAELIEDLPEPRRSNIRDRFADAVRRLDEAGLLETLRRTEKRSTDERQRLGITYFRLGIPCPFLEEESCSIHADRPLACREYLVTSPAANCADPTPEGIEGVPMPVRLSGALARFTEAAGAGSAMSVPLILALEWAEAHPDLSPARPGPDWITLLFQRLTGQEAPAPPTDRSPDGAPG
jgi:Fe-S-cluster containining protein